MLIARARACVCVRVCMCVHSRASGICRVALVAPLPSRPREVCACVVLRVLCTCSLCVYACSAHVFHVCVCECVCCVCASCLPVLADLLALGPRLSRGKGRRPPLHPCPARSGVTLCVCLCGMCVILCEVSVLLLSVCLRLSLLLVLLFCLSVLLYSLLVCLSVWRCSALDVGPILSLPL